jgi:hypothetical protein
MEYAVREIAPEVWRVEIAGAVRIIRYRPDSMTFAPWDICTEDGHRLWASPSLESAFRWIEARTGHPAEALLADGLLEQSASHERPKPAEGAAKPAEPARKIANPGGT